MTINETTQRYVLMILLIFIIIGIITSNMLGKKQDETYAAEDFLYQHALQLYETGDYMKAQDIVLDLLTDRGDLEVVNYLGGLITASNKDYQTASVLMQKALDINPHLVENPMFMLQFGEILFNAEHFNEARIVLEQCQKWEWAPKEYPNYQEQVATMLIQIENM